MGGDEQVVFHLSTFDWIGLIVALFAHAGVVFGCLLHWANRIVTVETKVAAMEGTLEAGLSELRGDIKTLLKRATATP